MQTASLHEGTNIQIDLWIGRKVMLTLSSLHAKRKDFVIQIWRKAKYTIAHDIFWLCRQTKYLLKFSCFTISFLCIVSITTGIDSQCFSEKHTNFKRVKVFMESWWSADLLTRLFIRQSYRFSFVHSEETFILRTSCHEMVACVENAAASAWLKHQLQKMGLFLLQVG